MMIMMMTMMMAIKIISRIVLFATTLVTNIAVAPFIILIVNMIIISSIIGIRSVSVIIVIIRRPKSC